MPRRRLWQSRCHDVGLAATQRPYCSSSLRQYRAVTSSAASLRGDTGVSAARRGPARCPPPPPLYSHPATSSSLRMRRRRSLPSAHVPSPCTAARLPTRMRLLPYIARTAHARRLAARTRKRKRAVAKGKMAAAGPAAGPADELVSSVTLYRRRPRLLHGTVLPFVAGLYPAWLWLWGPRVWAAWGQEEEEGAAEHREGPAAPEAALLTLAAIGVVHLLTALSGLWSVHAHCALTCVRVSPRRGAGRGAGPGGAASGPQGGCGGCGGSLCTETSPFRLVRPKSGVI